MQSPLTRSPPFFHLRLKPRQPFVWESRSLQYTPKELGGAAINVSERDLESLPHRGTRPAAAVGRLKSSNLNLKGLEHYGLKPLSSPPRRVRSKQGSGHFPQRQRPVLPCGSMMPAGFPYARLASAGQFSSRVWTAKGARHACKTEHLFHALPGNWPSFSDTHSSYHGPTVPGSLASSCFTFHAIAARLCLGRCLKLQSWRQPAKPTLLEFSAAICKMARCSIGVTVCGGVCCHLFSELEPPNA